MAIKPVARKAKPVILVVDDEEVVRILFQSLLDGEGLTAVLATDGASGIKMLEAHKPAVALIDKNLPDMSGLELIATQKKRFPNTEFIMITGYGSLDSAVKAMEVGAFSYLTKPFSDMEVVLDRIRAAVEINELKAETSQLRTHLSSISTPGDGAASYERELSHRWLSELRKTASFLESFLDKRLQPPPPAIWAKLVDMMAEHHQRLRQLIDDQQSKR